jgi:DHA1 family tetracycline resistance protein-like MFS transporter
VRSVRPLTSLALVTVLVMIPVTLLVPGLSELVREAHGGSRLDAHLFMAVNMLTGIAAVPLFMVLLRRGTPLEKLLIGALVIDALCFAGMGLARTLGQLMALRALDGAVHLPAVTLLMVAAGRFGAERKGAALGLVAGAIMIGVAVGAPLGGVLVSRGPGTVYGAGALILVVALLLAGSFAARVPAAQPARRGARYRWDRRAAHAWMPLVLGFVDRFSIGVFTSTFTLYLAEILLLTPRARGLLVSFFMVPFALLCYPAGRLADRHGWLVLLLIGNAGFGATYALYGIFPAAALPAAMVVSGVMSALMYAPNLVLVGEMARRGAGEGMYGAFQVAGSLGFLAGPLAGGAMVEVSLATTGAVAWETIFLLVGGLVVTCGGAAWIVLLPLARRWAAAQLNARPG